MLLVAGIHYTHIHSMIKLIFKEIVSDSISIFLMTYKSKDINPRPNMPSFVTWFTNGRWLPPPYELEIDGPKV